jgi:hypothetical protein
MLNGLSAAEHRGRRGQRCTGRVCFFVLDSRRIAADQAAGGRPERLADAPAGICHGDSRQR